MTAGPACELHRRELVVRKNDARCYMLLEQTVSIGKSDPVVTCRYMLLRRTNFESARALIIPFWDRDRFDEVSE